MWLLISFFLASSSADEYAPMVETVRSAKVEKDGLLYHVDSGGCTGKESFNLVKKGSKLTLFRQTPDTCKGLVPEGVKVFFSFKEIGIKSAKGLKLANPRQK